VRCNYEEGWQNWTLGSAWLGKADWVLRNVLITITAAELQETPGHYFIKLFRLYAATYMTLLHGKIPTKFAVCVNRKYLCIL